MDFISVVQEILYFLCDVTVTQSISLIQLMAVIETHLTFVLYVCVCVCTYQKHITFKKVIPEQG